MSARKMNISMRTIVAAVATLLLPSHLVLADNAFASNAQLPGFASPLSGTTQGAPTTPNSDPMPSDYVPPPPRPPMISYPGIVGGGGSRIINPSVYSPFGNNKRLTTSTTVPTGALPPPLPVLPPMPSPDSAPAPMVITRDADTQIIDPSKIKEGTVPVTGSVIKTRSGDPSIYLIHVSGTAPNLIESPFTSPRLLATSSSAVQFHAHGRNLVISVTRSGPIGVYITGDNPGDPLIGLVLDPSPTPPHTYSLEVAGYAPRASGSVTPENGATYIQSVVEMMKNVVAGHIPSDFTQTGADRLPGGQMFVGVKLTPIRQYVAPSQTVVVMTAQNENTHDVRLAENDFYTKETAAVVIDPKRNLKQGESTTVYVLYTKKMRGGALLGVWQGAGHQSDTSVGSN